MSCLTPKDGQFWLNDQPQFIQAGEFHYFRTPKDQWRHRLDILKAAGFNSLAAYIPWIWHQLEEDDSDFDGHSHPMRDLEGFLDLAAEMDFWIIPRPGPYIMAETINEGIPPWVFDKYPQAAFISQDNKIQNIASYMHPDFLACVSKWYQAIFNVLTPRQITRGGKIIMMQLDNEMGMMPWVRNIIDTNPDTISRFAAHLKKAYDKELPDRYPIDHLEEFLKEGILNPAEPYAEMIVEDYRRFYRDYLCEYASYLWSEAKSNGMEVLPVINIHGFGNGGKTFPIGLSQLVEVMAIDGMISATDVYPLTIGEGTFHQLLLVNEMTKALQNKKQPLFSIEFQSGGNLDFSNGQSSMSDLHSRLCISSGMRAINHYLFFGGDNDPILSPDFRHDWGHPVRTDGTLRKQYYRYPKLSNVLNTYGTDLVESRPKTVTTVGFLLDYFMTEVNNSFTKVSTNMITHQRDVVLFDMIARALAITHRPFDAVEISRSALDSARIPLLWVMMEKQCNADTQQKLVDYIHQGGKLILVGRMCVEDFHHGECSILNDAIGIQQVISDLPFIRKNINVFQYQNVPISFLETYTGEFDEIFATDESGNVTGFIKSVGRGKIMMFGAAMYTETLGDIDIVHQMAMKMSCSPTFKLSDWADVRISHGKNGSFLFINNYQDDPVETIIEYENEVLFGGNPICLAARTGLILPVDWQINNNVKLHYITSEIVKVTEDTSRIILKTQQNEFVAELTLTGVSCDDSMIITKSGNVQRVRMHGKDGVIILRNEGGYLH